MYVQIIKSVTNYKRIAIIWCLLIVFWTTNSLWKFLDENTVVCRKQHTCLWTVTAFVHLITNSGRVRRLDKKWARWVVIELYVGLCVRATSDDHNPANWKSSHRVQCGEVCLGMRVSVNFFGSVYCTLTGTHWSQRDVRRESVYTHHE